jgi:hypothetical protein
MNLSERLRVDKELFSGERSSYKNTMNLSERLRVDKELFSGERSSYENTMNLSERLRVDKELFSGERSSYKNTHKIVNDVPVIFYIITSTPFKQFTNLIILSVKQSHNESFIPTFISIFIF